MTDMIGWDHHIELLHIYAQPFCHDEAFIVGNITGLTRLRDAIQRVIDSRGADAAEVMTTDGEGYPAIVVYAALWPANIPAVKRWYAAERAKRTQSEHDPKQEVDEVPK